MIHNMTGGGAALHVRGGSVCPPAAPNCIWVNTTEQISSWCCSPLEPQQPTEGMLWLIAGTSSNAALTLGSRNSLVLCPRAAAQYSGGQWLSRQAMACVNGQWTELVMKLYLYSGGETHNELTGGYSSACTGDATVQYKSDSVKFHCGWRTVSGIYTNRSMDLSLYSKLYVKSSTELKVALSQGSQVIAELGRADEEGVYMDIAAYKGQYQIMFYIGKTGDTTLDASLYEAFLES